MHLSLLDPDDIERRAPTYALAFAEAGRALDAQERAVNELRSRAGVLVAAAAIAMSFFGGHDGFRHDTPRAAWVAIVAFVLVGGAVLAILWPRHDWQFSADATDLIAAYAEPDAVTLAVIHRDLALHRAASYVDNGRQLRALIFIFRAGLIMLIVEVSGWVVALAQAA